MALRPRNPEPWHSSHPPFSKKVRAAFFDTRRGEATPKGTVETWEDVQAVFAVSEKAYAKAATIKDRGYYFDILEFKKNQENNMTPTTPSG